MTIKEIMELHVLEWSTSQECFHIHKVRDMIADNRDMARGHSFTDFLPIAIAETYEELNEIRERSYSELVEKSEEKWRRAFFESPFDEEGSPKSI